MNDFFNNEDDWKTDNNDNELFHCEKCETAFKNEDELNENNHCEKCAERED